MMKVLDLFSGIGGFSLGLERTGGFETVAFCEIEDYPRKVLAKHWPNVPIYKDVRNVTGETLSRDGIAVNVITGGFPCQDISVCGHQAGLKDGTRSGLWSEIIRLADEIRPKYVIVENVSNLLAGPNDQPGEAGASLLPPNFDGLGSADDSYTIRGGDGFPEFMGQLNCLGNSVVPQIPEMIGNAILEAEHEFTT